MVGDGRDGGNDGAPPGGPRCRLSSSPSTLQRSTSSRAECERFLSWTMWPGWQWGRRLGCWYGRSRWSEWWAKDNAVEFETSKTEATLFTRKRKHWKKRAEARTRVGEHTIQFNKEVTRWLGIWLDSSLKLTTHRQKRINRAKVAERRLRSLVDKFGTTPATARTLQTAIIQSTMLYGAELTWDGKKTHAQQYQLAINRWHDRRWVLSRQPPGGLDQRECPDAG